ncbi:MAG: hypothetical protein A3B38_03925 [Candidatus Levybacteria bacterium RIFCSPLOWO2_01_FULL_36_13]|nr:MAG: hypothetical protein A2684_00860 [Candidatus Levybacteria bacterium RIFCSPHIGHO2_01_FULL_36_15b]OGH34278.1 MAG: hypothetical protein A3B38_03925 [Candidatus Levybacteria bacterium RIFCSPLOWO2_01_FULL_36_13]
MKTLNQLSWWLLVIGGLNWGLVGLNASWNVVHMLLGTWSTVEMLVYVLVGLSALYQAALQLGLMKK